MTISFCEPMHFGVHDKFFKIFVIIFAKFSKHFCIQCLLFRFNCLTALMTYYCKFVTNAFSN